MALPPDVQRLFEAWGRQGGRKRARRLTKAQQTAIAKAGARARWKGHTPKAKAKRRKPRMETP